jgi:hypothetical protein
MSATVFLAMRMVSGLRHKGFEKLLLQAGIRQADRRGRKPPAMATEKNRDAPRASRLNGRFRAAALIWEIPRGCRRPPITACSTRDQYMS